MKPIIALSGGWDPIHSGHIDMFKEAALHGDIVAILNSDDWLTRKKGRPFMDWKNRSSVIKNMKGVIDVIAVDDRDNTVVDGLAQIKKKYKDRNIIFANGGDRVNDTTPEVNFCEENDIGLRFNVGGEKRDSSSNLLDDWREPKTKRGWGHWSVLKEYKNKEVKVKELVVYPSEKLSFQRHEHRNELWFVAEGEGWLQSEKKKTKLNKFDIITIKVGEWHQLIGGDRHLLHVVEIQWGDKVIEEDIERKKRRGALRGQA